MEITIRNTPLRGEVTAPPSKSDAHRALICAALSDSPTDIAIGAGGTDIGATVDCLASLGARIARSGDSAHVEPISRMAAGPLLDCAESASTLRFLLPVAAAVADRAEFTGRGRLAQRPIEALLSAMGKNGCASDSSRIPLRLSGGLHAGRFELPGNISSQFISGLLMALPILDSDSQIVLTTPLESAAYVDMTINTLRRFGVEVCGAADGYTVKGKQRFHSPGVYTVEGDWSAAAYFIVANAIGGYVSILGTNPYSAQPDREIVRLMRDFPDSIDVSAFPDLFPALAVRACAKRGDTLLRNAGRLRIKESDRIAETARLIGSLGGRAEELPDALLVRGSGRLCGGKADSAGDHRIAMAAGIAAAICESPVTITGAESVEKSYPAFWDELERLAR